MRSISHTSPFRVLASLGAVALLAAACSSSGGASPAPSVASAPPPAASEAPPAAAATVTVSSGALGDLLVGPEGKTLYLFTPDSANTTTCVDSCAENWPALVVAAGETPTGGEGVSGTLSTFARPDGSLQVAYNGIPLYYFAGDNAAGDTNGQGVGDKWFVVPSSGEVPAASDSGSAY
jgi:predicted lipoprotein with Yx(FWY)xxD motif